MLGNDSFNGTGCTRHKELGKGIRKIIYFLGEAIQIDQRISAATFS